MSNIFDIQEEYYDYNYWNENNLLIQDDYRFQKPNCYYKEECKEEYLYLGYNFGNKEKDKNNTFKTKISTKENSKNDKECKEEFEEKQESDKIDIQLQKDLLEENFKLNEIENKNIEKKAKNKCGKKRRRAEKAKNEHNKFSDDNLRRKCKHLVLKNIMEYINYS